MDTLTRLEHTITARKGTDPAASYVAQLHNRGVPVMARKLGEEAVEAAVAALSGSREELVALAATRGIPLQPSLLERFERLAPISGPETLSDAELQAVSAGGSVDPVLLGLRAQLPVLLAL